MTVLQQIAAKNPAVAASLDGVLPDPDKAELRTRQKQINSIRKLQQKIERKEAAMQRRDAQMSKFLEEIKNHVTQERQRFKQDMDELKKEITEAKAQLQISKMGKSHPRTSFLFLFFWQDERCGKDEDVAKKSPCTGHKASKD